MAFLYTASRSSTQRWRRLVLSLVRIDTSTDEGAFNDSDIEEKSAVEEVENSMLGSMETLL
jgi:hypothetical protein